MKNTQLVNNLLFIGRKFYLRPNSKKYINFNISEFARQIDVTSETVTKWIKGGDINNTNLSRLCKSITELLNGIEITPYILMNESIEQKYFNKSIIKETESFYGIDKQIFDILNKYPKLKPHILQFLKDYDSK